MKKTLLAVVTASVIGLSGCASTPTEQVAGGVGNTASSAIDDAALQAKKKINDMAAKIEQQYLSAKNENFAYFAPEHWQEVNNKIAEMRTQVNEFDPNDQGFFGGPSEEDVIESIDETDVALEDAAKIKELVAVYLAQPIEDITFLTPKIKPQWKASFTAINRSLSRLITDIEDDEETKGYDARRATIQASLLKLEIKIVKNNHYAPLLKRNKQLSKTLIPKSYKQVQNALVALNDTIERAPRDMKVIKEFSENVEHALLRAKNVTTEVKWIRSVERGKAETIALRYRNAVESAAEKLVSEDISGLSFSGQVAKLESLLDKKFSSLRLAEEKHAAEQSVLINALKAQLNAALERAKTVKSQSAQDKMKAIQQKIEPVTDNLDTAVTESGVKATTVTNIESAETVIEETATVTGNTEL